MKTDHFLLKVALLSLVVGLGLSGLVIVFNSHPENFEIASPGNSKFNQVLGANLSSVVSTTQTKAPLQPSPTAKPLTLAEMNQLYGPCAIVPTLMYHHIQDLAQAKAQGHLGLAVSPDWFVKQMDQLTSKHYSTVSMADLANFFDNNTPLPPKPILLTFDDAYEDFFFNAYPTLLQRRMKATMFVPTGLVDNYGYLNWGEVQNMASSGLILFANHTWSHRDMSVAPDVVQKEISLADQQLTQKGYDSPKVFADPYGNTTAYSIQYLSQTGYKLAFTTKPGSVLCRGQRLSLPRVRIGNADIGRFGL